VLLLNMITNLLLSDIEDDDGDDGEAVGFSLSLSLSFLCLSFCFSSFGSLMCSAGVATAANDFASSALNSKSE
jgi:hypothetical protein